MQIQTPVRQRKFWNLRASSEGLKPVEHTHSKVIGRYGVPASHFLTIVMEKDFNQRIGSKELPLVELEYLVNA